MMPAEDITDATSRQSNTAGKCGGGEKGSFFLEWRKERQGIPDRVCMPRGAEEDSTGQSNSEPLEWGGEDVGLNQARLVISHGGHIARLLWASASQAVKWAPCQHQALRAESRIQSERQA